MPLPSEQAAEDKNLIESLKNSLEKILDKNCTITVKRSKDTLSFTVHSKVKDVAPPGSTFKHLKNVVDYQVPIANCEAMKKFINDSEVGLKVKASKTEESGFTVSMIDLRTANKNGKLAKLTQEGDKPTP